MAFFETDGGRTIGRRKSDDPFKTPASPQKLVTVVVDGSLQSNALPEQFFSSVQQLPEHTMVRLVFLGSCFMILAGCSTKIDVSPPTTSAADTTSATPTATEATPETVAAPSTPEFAPSKSAQ